MSEKINFYDYNDRIDKIRKLTKEFREIIENKFPEITEIDVELITETLGIELKHYFRKFWLHTRKPFLFTIQNVPIKSTCGITIQLPVTWFTIQNVPIKLGK